MSSKDDTDDIFMHTNLCIIFLRWVFRYFLFGWLGVAMMGIVLYNLVAPCIDYLSFGLRIFGLDILPHKSGDALIKILEGVLVLWFVGGRYIVNMYMV